MEHLLAHATYFSFLLFVSTRCRTSAEVSDSARPLPRSLTSSHAHSPFQRSSADRKRENIRGRSFLLRDQLTSLLPSLVLRLPFFLGVREASWFPLARPPRRQLLTTLPPSEVTTLPLLSIRQREAEGRRNHNLVDQNNKPRPQADRQTTDTAKTDQPSVAQMQTGQEERKEPCLPGGSHR